MLARPLSLARLQSVQLHGRDPDPLQSPLIYTRLHSTKRSESCCTANSQRYVKPEECFYLPIMPLVVLMQA